MKDNYTCGRTVRADSLEEAVKIIKRIETIDTDTVNCTYVMQVPYWAVILFAISISIIACMVYDTIKEL
jgi:hypothetical protein